MNIQTIPRKDTIIKQAFYPKQDFLLFADYSAIEYRIWAWYMQEQVGDSTLVDGFIAGKDVHAEQAIKIHEALGWSIDSPPSDTQRQIGKTSNFAAVYAGGIPTVERQLGCSKHVARSIVDAFHGANPLLGRWEWRGRGYVDPSPDTLNGVLCQTLYERGYIRDLWGRELFPEAPRFALNQLCQGGAADLMKKAMVNIAENLESHQAKSHLVLNVHDEIAIDGVDDELEDLVAELPLWMDDSVVSDVLPVEVDMKIARASWAEAEGV